MIVNCSSTRSQPRNHQEVGGSAVVVPSTGKMVVISPTGRVVVPPTDTDVSTIN